MDLILFPGSKAEAFTLVVNPHPNFARSAHYADSILRALRRASIAGHIREARQWQNTYLRSPHGKLACAQQAWSRFARRNSPGTVLDLARSLDCKRLCTEAVRYYDQPKESGGSRRIHSFGLLQTARQLMVQKVLRASFVPPAFQFEHRGRGGEAAIREVFKLITHGCTCAAALDIANCFPSFEGGKVERLLPLPLEVTRTVILTSGLAVTNGTSPFSAICSAHDRSRLQPSDGLPQGSVVSNLVASYLLADLGQVVGQHCHLIGFRDDLVVLGRTKKAVSESVTALREALLHHRAGKLELRPYEIVYVHEGFQFLGYEIRRVRGLPFAQPSQQNMMRIMHALAHAFLNDLASGSVSAIEVERMLNKKLLAFRNWSFGGYYVQDWVDACRAMIKQHQ